MVGVLLAAAVLLQGAGIAAVSLSVATALRNRQEFSAGRCVMSSGEGALDRLSTASCKEPETYLISARVGSLEGFRDCPPASVDVFVDYRRGYTLCLSRP
jgi:hypothetical protein